MIAHVRTIHQFDTIDATTGTFLYSIFFDYVYIVKSNFFNDVYRLCYLVNLKSYSMCITEKQFETLVKDRELTYNIGIKMISTITLL